MPQFVNNVCFFSVVIVSIMQNNVHGTPAAVVFDPCCLYGHREFEVAYWMMNEFPPSFLETYMRMIPLETGFQERKTLYQLYYHINHW